jgi:hypothetical protein
MATASVPVEQQVAHVADRLVADFSGQVPDAVVRGLVDQVYAAFREARVQQFVPVLVDRSVRVELSRRRPSGS